VYITLLLCCDSILDVFDTLASAKIGPVGHIRVCMSVRLLDPVVTWLYDVKNSPEVSMYCRVFISGPVASAFLAVSLFLIFTPDVPCLWRFCGPFATYPIFCCGLRFSSFCTPFRCWHPVYLCRSAISPCSSRSDNSVLQFCSIVLVLCFILLICCLFNDTVRSDISNGLVTRDWLIGSDVEEMWLTYFKTYWRLLGGTEENLKTPSYCSGSSENC
jgi:hypothetical protein